MKSLNLNTNTMKKYISLVALLAAGSAFANADVVLDSAALNILTEITENTETWSGDWDVSHTLVDKTGQDTSPGTGTLSFSFTLSNLGEGTHNILSVASDAPWIGNKTNDKVGYGFFYENGTLVFARIDSNQTGNITIDDSKTTILSNLQANTNYDISIDLNIRGSTTITANGNEKNVTGFGLNGDKFHSIFAGSANGLNGTITKVTVSPLTIIPEPSAFGLLAGLGALALVGTRRRRR